MTLHDDRDPKIFRSHFNDKYVDLIYLDRPALSLKIVE